MTSSQSFRVVSFVLCAAAIATMPRAGTNLDWTAAFLIGGVFGAISFIWLLNQRSLADAEWAQLISWREPFYPMRRYPFRFWLFAGESTALGGCIAMAVDAFNGTGYISFGATFLVLGVAMMGASTSAFAMKVKHG